ncbi:MAG: prolipoprotein diacylglyceryl transferase [Phycisphaerales bacterium]
MLTLADWVHNLSPFALRISGDFGLRWYGLSYLLGFVIAWWVLKLLARRGALRIEPERVTDLMLWLVVGVIVGGRLGYCVVYQPSLLWSVSGGFPFWGVLRLNQGGMASHGGLIGVIAAAWWYGRRQGVHPLHILDCLALVAPIGLMLGRIANFINGELLGRIVAGRGEPGPWWSVRYPQELLERGSELPPLSAGEAAAIEELIVRADAAMQGIAGGAYGAAADRLVAQTLSDPNVEILGAYPVLIEAIQRGHDRLAQELGPLLTARHPSQLYQAGVEGPFVLSAVWGCWLAGSRSPGQCGAVFMASYGIGRIATEFFRLPDAHLQVARVLGLSRGQWLSVGMIVAGALLWAWASRARARTHEPAPGDSAAGRGEQGS